MDFRQLRYFQKVAQEGNVSRAAAALNVAQPAVSRLIKRLELELGVEVLQRHPRGVSLTPAGEELLSRANVLLRQLDLASLEIRAQAQTPVGHVSIAVLPTVAQVLAAPLVQRAVRELPEVTLTVREGYSGSIRDWLLGGTVDFAVLYNVKPQKGWEIIDLYQERMCLIGSPRLRPAVSEPIPVAELVGLPLMLPSPANGLRSLIDRAVAWLGVELKPRLEIDSFMIMLELVKQGVGYAILPASAVTGDVAAGRLWSTELTDPEVGRTLALVRLTDRPLSLAARGLRDVLLAELDHLVESRAWPAERQACQGPDNAHSKGSGRT